MTLPGPAVVLAGVLAAALGVLGGCGADDGGAPARPPALSARAATARAVAALMQAPGGTFVVHVAVAGATYDDDGAWTTDPWAQHTTRRAVTGTGRAYVVDAIGVDRHFYARAEVRSGDGEAVSTGGCWLRGRFGDVADASGAAFTVPGGATGDAGRAGSDGSDAAPDRGEAGLEPSALLAAATVRGAAYVGPSPADASGASGAAGVPGTGDTINGTISLSRALALADPRLPARLGVHGGRVSASLDVVDGVLRGLSVTARSFAIARGLPHDGDPLAGATLVIRFVPSTDPEPIDAPPASQVTELHRGPQPLGPRQTC